MDFLEALAKAKVEIKARIKTHPNPNYSNRDINQGFCNNFADRVVELVGNSIYTEWGCDKYPELDKAVGMCHNYIVYRGLYYDAECFTGVDKPHDLPFYQRVLAKRR